MTTLNNNVTLTEAELKAIKQRYMILEEKEIAAKALRQDIKNIKTKLGIE